MSAHDFGAHGAGMFLLDALQAERPSVLQRVSLSDLVHVGNSIVAKARDGMVDAATVDALTARNVALATALGEARDAIRRLGKCGTCKGDGKYRAFMGYDEAGGAWAQPIYESVPCGTCEGEGIYTSARDEIAKIDALLDAAGGMGGG